MTLDAGPALDARIAREVMGWKRHPHMRDCWELPCGLFKQKHYFTPSTSIVYAWLVVEKMHADGRIVLLGQGDIPDSGWKVVFDDGTAGVLQAEATTAPLAICRAALAATH